MLVVSSKTDTQRGSNEREREGERERGSRERGIERERERKDIYPCTVGILRDTSTRTQAQRHKHNTHTNTHQHAESCHWQGVASDGFQNA